MKDLRTLPNGFEIDMAAIQYIITEFTPSICSEPARLVVACKNAEVTLLGTPEQINECKDVILKYINETYSRIY